MRTKKNIHVEVEELPKSKINLNDYQIIESKYPFKGKYFLYGSDNVGICIEEYERKHGKITGIVFVDSLKKYIAIERN